MGISNGGTRICTSSVLTLNTLDGVLHYYRRGNPSSAGITVMARVIVHQPNCGTHIGISATAYKEKDIMIEYDKIYGVPVQGGEWHTILVALDNSSGLVKLWIDGELKKEATVGRPFSFAVLFGKEWVYWNPLNSTWDYVYYVRGYYQLETEEVKEDITGNRLQLLPNPFTWQTKVLGHEDEEFILFDILGNEIRTYLGKRIGRGLLPGIYFLKPADGGDVVKMR